MSKEPVAWKSTLQTDWYISNEKIIEGKYDANYWIPLYTAPRELSDDEIKQIFADETGFVLDDSPMALLDFARAILKKASEK